MGPVLDLSLGGARVFTTRPYRGRRGFTLWSTHGRLSVPALAVWSRRLGFRRYEVGLQFEGVDSGTAELLTEISTAHALTLDLAA